MRIKHFMLVFSILLVLGSAIAIVWFSGQDSGQSNGLSRMLAARILSFLPLAQTTENLELVNLVLRKLAHFSLYFLLGLGLTGLVRRPKKASAVLMVIIFGLVFAAGDEFHQQFSQGRSSSGWDVLLDTCGAAAGVTAFIRMERLHMKK